MAKRSAAENLFDDGSMTFGEHIEELRTHLLRAVWGVAVAAAFTIIFAHKIVEILTLPLQGTLENYHRARIAKQSDIYWNQQQLLPADERAKIPLTASLDAESAARLLGKPPESSAALKLKLTLDAAELVKSLSAPLAEINQPWSIKTLSAQEPFLMYFKATIGAAIVIACPWVFYQIYAFIAVGLYAHERRFVRGTIPFCILLFLTGVAFCYFVMLPLMLRFLIGANEWLGVQPDIRLNEWIGFCVLLMLVFGAAFQLPLLMLILERIGLVTHKMLSGKRKHAVLGIFVFAAVATPTPDPISQSVLALPLYGLFELGLLLMRRPMAMAEESEEPPTLYRAFDDMLYEQVGR